MCSLLLYQSFTNRNPCPCISSVSGFQDQSPIYCFFVQHHSVYDVVLALELLQLRPVDITITKPLQLLGFHLQLNSKSNFTSSPLDKGNTIWVQRFMNGGYPWVSTCQGDSEGSNFFFFFNSFTSESTKGFYDGKLEVCKETWARILSLQIYRINKKKRPENSVKSNSQRYFVVLIPLQNNDPQRNVSQEPESADHLLVFNKSAEKTNSVKQLTEAFGSNSIAEWSAKNPEPESWAFAGSFNKGRE